jgi:hypothetical protein
MAREASTILLCLRDDVCMTTTLTSRRFLPDARPGKSGFSEMYRQEMRGISLRNIRAARYLSCMSQRDPAPGAELLLPLVLRQFFDDKCERLHPKTRARYLRVLERLSRYLETSSQAARSDRTILPVADFLAALETGAIVSGQADRQAAKLVTRMLTTWLEDEGYAPQPLIEKDVAEAGAVGGAAPTSGDRSYTPTMGSAPRGRARPDALD